MPNLQAYVLAVVVSVAQLKDLWSVTTVNFLPAKKQSNLSIAKMIARASCSRVE